MSEKRLSEIMSDSSRTIADAQDVLDKAITNAIHIHFDAGVTTERERIIKLFEDFITKQSSYIDDETPADIAEGYLVEIESAEYWIDRIKGEDE